MNAIKATSIKSFLHIYNNCDTSNLQDASCYTNYMEGAKLLYKFLAPIHIPTKLEMKALTGLAPEEISKLNALSSTSLNGYGIQQLTLILAGNLGYKHPAFNLIQGLIVFYTAQSLLSSIKGGVSL